MLTACSTPSITPAADPALRVERLAGPRGARAELVLLPGWSMDREIWRELLPRLRQKAHLTLLDFQGAWQEEELLEAILRAVPKKAIYAGWSLGGNIAVALAARAPQRVQAVLTLACNPRFVSDIDWPVAMSSHDFGLFCEQVKQAPARSLCRFDALQSGGGEHERESLRWCRKMRQGQSIPQGLEESLDLLQTLDVRERMSGLTQPVSHILGEGDQLVPVALLDELARHYPQQRRLVVTACNHLLPLYAVDQINDELQSLLQEVGLAPGRQVDGQRDKMEVARSFSRAAASYDGVAELQRQVGEQLLARWPEAQHLSRILDLGSGTGYFLPRLHSSSRGAEYIGLDLAEGMVRYARQQHGTGLAKWLVADAEDLPLADASVDLVFSSLAIQWSEDLPRLFSEVARVLRPGGCLLFATLGPRTLWELRQSWASVDSGDHVNEFLPLDEIERALDVADFGESTLETCPLGLRYSSALDLLRELKALGAHNVNRGRTRGLTGRRQLQAMQLAYERHRQEGYLPASYEVIYGRVQKRVHKRVHKRPHKKDD